MKPMHETLNWKVRNRNLSKLKTNEHVDFDEDLQTLLSDRDQKWHNQEQKEETLFDAWRENQG